MAGPFTLKTHIPHFVDFAHGNEDEFLYGYLSLMESVVINGKRTSTHLLRFTKTT